ncbi:MAG: oligosaccharide flippase family protein [Bacteroidia bacterium]|nr:oligosaccharide flippase family protein [Bacteroidia bacterium]
MQRKFIGNLFILQLLNWLVKPLWIFGIDRLAQVQLGDEWYGKYYVVFSFGLLFNILLDFGLNNYVAAKVGKDGNPNAALPVAKLRIWLAFAYIFVVLALGIWQQFDPVILLLVIANQLLAGFVLFFRSILQGRHLFRTDSLVSVLDRIVAIVLCGILVFGDGFKAYNGVLFFLGAQTLGYFLALIISIWFAFKGANKSEQKLDQLPIQELLRSSAWFAVLAFSMSVFTRLDALMIKNLSSNGYAEAGLYAQSFRLLDAALIFSSLISTMLLPVLSRMIQNKEETDKLVWLNLRIVLFVAIPAALAAWFFGGDILNMLYQETYSNPQEFLQSQAVFVPLLTCFIPMSLIHIFGTWLTAGNQIKTLSYLAIISVLVNVGVNYIAIPRYGAVGAAWACLLTQSLFAFLCVAIAIKNGAIRMDLNRIFMLVIWILTAVLVFYFIEKNIPGIAGMLSACLAFVVATLLSRIFHTELIKLFRK